MKYRALDPKDIHEAGDEFKHRGQWLQVGGDEGEPVGDDFPCRRPITEPDSPWIPISTPPTEADGDKHGQVLSRGIDGSVTNCHFHHAVWPHWMRIPPLPEPAPTKNEVLAESIVAAIRPDWIAPKSLTKTILDVLNAENQE